MPFKDDSSAIALCPFFPLLYIQTLYIHFLLPFCKLFLLINIQFAQLELEKKPCNVKKSVTFLLYHVLEALFGTLAVADHVKHLYAVNLNACSHRCNLNVLVDLMERQWGR